MGLVESCRRQIEQCNKTEESETNPNSTQKTETSEGLYEDVENDIQKNNTKLKEDTNIWHRYKELATINTDEYSTLKKVGIIGNNETIRAMKIIPKKNFENENAIKNLTDEINILKTFDHPNIIKILDFFIDEENVYIITEYFNQVKFLGKIMKLGKLNQMSVKYLLEQIFNVISYAKSKNINNIYLKPENILICDNTHRPDIRRFSVSLNLLDLTINKDQMDFHRHFASKKRRTCLNNILTYDIKIFIFGCSKYITDKNSSIDILYYSPEFIENNYDEKCDQWACGVLMYMLSSGRPPFNGMTIKEVLENMKKKNINFKLKQFKNVTENYIKIIKELLEPESKNRLAISDTLIHPFFTEYFDSKTTTFDDDDLYILTKIINFKKPISKFHQDIFEYICKKFLNNDEESKLSDIFKYLDKEGKNGLSKENIKNNLREINIICPEKKLNDAFEIVDMNKSGLIEYSEFIMACCDKDTMYTLSNIKKVFEAINESNNVKGVITSENIKKFIFGDKMTDKEFKEYLSEFGMNKYSKVKFEDFFDIIKNDKKLNENKDENIKSNEKKDGSAKKLSFNVKKKLSFGRISVIETDYIKDDYSDEE